MKKPNIPRKLALSPETIRTLDRARLDPVAGGRSYAVSTQPTCDIKYCDP